MQTKKTFIFKSLSNFHKKTILIKLVKNINLEQISGYKFVSRTVVEICRKNVGELISNHVIF